MTPKFSHTPHYYWHSETRYYSRRAALSRGFRFKILQTESTFAPTIHRIRTQLHLKQSCDNNELMSPDNSSHSLDPHVWLWFFCAWIILITASQVRPLWKWIQRNRAKNWPLANGQIESVDVNNSKASFIPVSSRSNSPTCDAGIGYSYSANGNAEAGTYKREFGSEEEAWEFLRDLNGKSVAVHYNPNKTSASTLSEQSIETLLQTRAPGPAVDSFLPSPLSPFFSRFIWLFVALSAVGLVVSLWVHVGAVAGQRVLPEEFFFILHAGIFVVWIRLFLLPDKLLAAGIAAISGKSP